MAQPHELDPNAMARLIESPAWQYFLRQCLLPSFEMAQQQYNQVKEDHRFWQGFLLGLTRYIERPYETAGRRSPLERRWAVEPEPLAPAAAEATPPEPAPPGRPLRRTTFPV